MSSVSTKFRARVKRGGLSGDGRLKLFIQRHYPERNRLDISRWQSFQPGYMPEWETVYTVELDEVSDFIQAVNNGMAEHRKEGIAE